MDIKFGEESLACEFKEKVVIAKQQRNGRKCWTIIENFTDHIDKDAIKKFIKCIKKSQCCNGAFLEKQKTVQFQGDCTDFVKKLLIEKYDYTDEDVVIKGI
jgi:translation initiation factor SUI1